MQPLIDEFGHERVWFVGLDVLGYPPNWTPGPSITEVNRVRLAIEQGA